MFEIASTGVFPVWSLKRYHLLIRIVLASPSLSSVFQYTSDHHLIIPYPPHLMLFFFPKCNFWADGQVIMTTDASGEGGAEGSSSSEYNEEKRHRG